MTERANDIKQHTLQHSAGIIFVYKNSTADKVLNETLGFELEGLKIEGQDDQSEVKISIGPGEQQVINLATTGGGYSYGSSCSFLVEDYTGPPKRAQGAVKNFKG